MLRITTGTAKNKRLKIPEIAGFRGVQEKAKLSLFSIIGDRIKGAVCLDLFAGSGNLGIEALSRGASVCDFVDDNSLCAEAIEANLHNCGFLGISEVFRKSAVKYVEHCNRLYDIIFIDPFYSNTSHKHLFKLMPMILKAGGVVAFFHRPDTEIKNLLDPDSLKIFEERSFGKSSLTLITHST